MSDSLEIKFDEQSRIEVIGHIHEYDEKLRAGLLLITKQVAQRMQDWAKVNARWTDRTGHARQGLKASANWEDYINLVVAMSHTVDYGPWLELCYGKKYSILQPAIDKYQDEFIDQWTQMINGIKTE